MYNLRRAAKRKQRLESEWMLDEIYKHPNALSYTIEELEVITRLLKKKTDS